MPSHLFLTIHESVGHPTELDRALGYEANFAGTSYLTPEKLARSESQASTSASTAIARPNARWPQWRMTTTV